MTEWSKHVLDDRITFDAAWTKMGLHHDVPRTHLVDEGARGGQTFLARDIRLCLPVTEDGRPDVGVHQDGQPSDQRSARCQVHHA